MNLMEEIRALEGQMIEDRRYLHRYPELSEKEFQTTEFIRKKLNEFGVEIENLDIPTELAQLSGVISQEKRSASVMILMHCRSRRIPVWIIRLHMKA